jgi:hypothetical protein
VIRFKSVNPVDGAEYLPTVIIPDGTNVVLVYGIAGTLDSLATSGMQYLMRDMLVRGTIRSASHIPAAAFLRDGSRTMLANINMDGHQVVNCQAILGPGMTPLHISNRYVPPYDRVLFSDKWVSSVALANQGCTSPYTPGSFWPSILGVLNSNAKMSERIHGNRVIDRGGALDWQAGYLNVPAMTVCLNGEAVPVAAQRFPAVGTVTTSSNRWLVVDAVGALQERAGGAVLTTDVLLAYYITYDAVNWSAKADARWTYNGSSATFEVTCAPATYKGADFTDLQLACDFVAAISANQPTGRFNIRLLGAVTLPDTLDVSNYPWYFRAKIKGDNPLVSKIMTSTSTSWANKHMVKINGTGSSGDNNRLDFEDISFQWMSTVNQNNGYAAIFSPGDRAEIKDCLFYGNTNSLHNVVLYNSSGTPIAHGLEMSHCYFSQVLRCIVDANGRGHGIVVKDCYGENCNSTEFAFRLTTADNKVLNTQITGDPTHYFTHGVNIGCRGEIGGCYFYIRGGAAITVNNPNTGEVTIDAHNNFLEMGVGNGLFINNDSGQDCRISFQHNTIKGASYGVYIDNGSSHTGVIDISGNRFTGQLVTAIHCANYGRVLNIISNHFTSQSGDVISLLDNYEAHIVDNIIDGYGSGSSNFALNLDGAGGRAWVRGNDIKANGAHVSSVPVLIHIPDIEFHANKIDGYDYVGDVAVSGCVQVYEGGDGGSYVGNRFIQAGNFLLSFSQGTVDEVGRCTITSNIFGNVPNTGWQLIVAGFNHMMIGNNIFGREADNYVGGVAIGVLNLGKPSTHIKIVGNNFKRINGLAETLYPNGVVVINHQDNHSCVISDNTFEWCGIYDSTDWVFSVIHSGGKSSAVTGNIIRNTLGPLNALASVTCIKLFQGRATCTGNKIYQDVSLPGQTYGTFIGIYLDDEYCTVTGNELYITGTISAPPPGGWSPPRSYSIYGIKNDDSYSGHSVVGNNIPIKWVNASGANYSIHMGTADYCAVVGNRASWGISCAGGGHNIVTGNFATMLIDPGANATSGNVDMVP